MDRRRVDPGVSQESSLEEGEQTGMKCGQCGLESDVVQAFKTQRNLFGLDKKTYCPVCWEKRLRFEQWKNTLWSLTFITILSIVLPWRSDFGWLLLDAVLILFILNGLVIIHELAHAALGLLSGLRVFGVAFGRGRLVFSGRIFGILWEVRILPAGGATRMVLSPRKPEKWRLFLAVLAGPLAHGIFLCVSAAGILLLIALSPWLGGGTDLLLRFASLFFASNLIMLIVNIVPLQVGVPAGKIGTDGWKLLRLVFPDPKEEAARELVYYVMECHEAMQRRDPDSTLRWAKEGLSKIPGHPALLNYQGVGLLMKHRPREAREVFLSQLSSEEAAKPQHKYILLNNVAYADVLLEDPQLLAEADGYSAEALRQMWWEPSIAGTRGAVLVELGRLDEGIALLRESLEKHKDPYGRAANACHLAIGESRRGDLEMAKRYYQLARKLDSGNYLLERVDKAIRGV
jgi:hypothetical protein